MFDIGLCATCAPRAREDVELLVVEMDAMRQHRALVETSEMVEMAHDGAAIAGLDVRLLGARLGAWVQKMPPHLCATACAAFRFSGATV